ncbi:MAG: altronate dehydratase [Verrucomicrobia bacterium]|nr:altronate dehydratase [Verrucomicrobiota bacterium]
MAALSFHEFALQLHSADNVAVLKRSVPAGADLAGREVRVTTVQPIPAGHKVALVPMAPETPVLKYGQVIGFATRPIAPGEHVHTHNLAVRDFYRDPAFGVDALPVAFHPPEAMRNFPGYARPGGRVGTRNYLAILSSVNCSASVARQAAARFPVAEVRRDYPGVDGVVAFTHRTGCAVQPGEPLAMLQRVFAGFARHPNIAGCVFVGLGCEVNQLRALRERHALDRVPAGAMVPVFLEIQDVGGTVKAVEAAAGAVARLLPEANALRRTPQPVRALVLAEQCGGSDAHSGITANPALGVACDELVRHGGTGVLAETPEIYGAEHLLTRRAVSRDVGERLLDRIRWWEEHVRVHGATIDNNPTQGNKTGGLTTIYEKSLGAIAKAGCSPLAAVYRYAEPITASGLCFMDTPGYDPVSMTGLVAGGCNVAVFTTGRGSVYGCKPVPCIKVASHTALYQSMQDDMDLNAGTILDGTESVELVGRRIFDKILAVAGGERTRSELAGLGDEEFAPWVLGPTF